MTDYQLSKTAEKDITQILEYSRITFGEKVTVKYLASLKKCLIILSKNPLIGQNVSYLRKGYFQHTHKSHIIFYKQKAKIICVMRILHKTVDINRYFHKE